MPDILAEPMPDTFTSPVPAAPPAPVPDALLAAPPRIVAGTTAFTKWVVDAGFLFGLILAAACLCLAAIFMFKFEASLEVYSKPASLLAPTVDVSRIRPVIAEQTYTMGVALRSCLLIISLAFGFLGFCLTLIGLNQPTDVEGEHQGSRLRLTSVAPGVLVILLASLLAATILLVPPKFEDQYTGPGEAANVKTEAGGGAAAPADDKNGSPPGVGVTPPP